MERSPLRVLAAATLAAGGLIALACTKVGTDPNVPVSIALAPPALPAMLKGDTLRNDAGAVAPLVATVFNVHDDPIVDAPVRFLSLDTTHTILVDSVTGVVTAKDTGQTLVVAFVGSLQAPPDTIVVVDTPTAVQNVDPLVDTLNYTFNGRDTLQALGVKVVHDTIGVRRVIVRYQFVYPAGLDNRDSTKVQLVDGNKQPSLVDTTDATGAVVRSLRIAPIASAFQDSVVVQATAVGPPGLAIAGNPVRFVIHVTITQP